MLGLFAGTGVGLGHLLSAVPGVELMSTNAGLAGAALGPAGGVAVALLSQSIYSLTSPFGPPVPLMLAAQLVGMSVAALLGAVAGPVARRRSGPLAALVAGGAGLVAALLQDLGTNLAIAWQFALPVVGVLASGVAVAALHLGTVAVAWAVLLPLLAGRLARLRRPGPHVVTVLVALLLALARPGASQVAAADTLAETPADSLATPAPDSLLAAEPPAAVAAADTVSGPRNLHLPEGWTRPLWQPFHATLEERLARTTGFVPVRDGGAGATLVILGEPGTAPAPEVVRDGMPLGVGNRFLDDPESLPLAGRDLVDAGYGLGAGGALGGRLELAGRDPWPDRDLVDTYWYAGPHETRLRDVQFLTADAVWRFGFDVYEHLDREGYDFRVPGEARYAELDEPLSLAFWGNAAVRAGRGRIQRRLADGSLVTVSVENARKHKHGVAVSDLDQQEIWRNTTQLRWQRGLADDPSEAAAWWTDTDLLLRPDGGGASRLIEGAREGARVVWAPPTAPIDLDVTYQRWTLRDSGAAASWSGASAGASSLAGEDVSLAAGRRWTTAWPVVTTLGAWWAQHGGAAVGGQVAAGGPRGWRATAAYGGRAPRSDELATPWRYVVPSGRQTVVLPDPELDREREWRLAGGWAGGLGGWDLHLEGSWRRLRHGIGWEATVDDPTVGRLVNGVDLDATTVTARLGRQGRFLGWVRFEAAGAWHTVQRRDALRIALPPDLDWRLSAVWEQRYFQEDGIVQLALYYHNRGAMDDPWSWSRAVALGSVTSLDAIAGFRLVGTNLSVELDNLMGAEARLTANAAAPPRELRWRLHWTFMY
ncbi:MAG: hypothetical protein R3D98_12430 [Candidatus Krumholzibacteriia bacterium]